jgi:hypothetical protein
MGVIEEHGSSESVARSFLAWVEAGHGLDIEKRSSIVYAGKSITGFNF